MSVSEALYRWLTAELNTAFLSLDHEIRLYCAGGVRALGPLLSGRRDSAESVGLFCANPNQQAWA